MRILVTGGTGVVGKAAVDHLLERKHSVRLFSRQAERDCEQWSDGVEAWPGDMAREADLRGAADGCDAVLHIAGIVREAPPEVTFRGINIDGTRHVVREAERAGVQRLVYVSSLGADRGASEYHQSKREAEEIVRGFAREWLICRPGNVYGPGDDVISLLLKIVRGLPVVPVISGDEPFQPVWADDLGRALARAVEPDAPAHAALNLAGPDVTTVNELFELMREITGKDPLHVPIPEWLAAMGTGMAETLGVHLPVTEDQIRMLGEGNVIAPGAANALTEVFGVRATPLREGLRQLAETLPERLPSDGTGPLRLSRYWADIQGSRLDADLLFQTVCRNFAGLAPEGLLEVGPEPGADQLSLEQGATITLAIPFRGDIQVRVEEIENHTATAVTLEGHPLSGAIRFLVEPLGDLLRFEVRSFTRASHLVDRIGIETIGEPMRKATWTSFVQAVVQRSGGKAMEGVQSETSTLEEDDARQVEEWAEKVVLRRRREEGAQNRARAGRAPAGLRGGGSESCAEG